MNEAQQYILKKNILLTLAYYDVSSIPLTAVEIFRFCIDRNALSGQNMEILEMKNVHLFDVVQQLETLKKQCLVQEKSGLYALINGTVSFSQSLIARKHSMFSLQKAYRWLCVLCYAPFVRTIFITGGLSFRSAHKGSDWDVLIIAMKNRIFSARFWMTIITHILGKRRYGKRVKERICLNHYISSGNISIRTKDLFSAREYAFAIPVGYTPLRERFHAVNASFIRKFLPFWRAPQTRHFFEEKKNPFLSKIQYFLEAILSWNGVEKKLRSMQVHKIQKNPIIPGSYIVVDDEALIFLPKPHGPRVYEAFLEKRSEMRL